MTVCKLLHTEYHIPNGDVPVHQFAIACTHHRQIQSVVCIFRRYSHKVNT